MNKFIAENERFIAQHPLKTIKLKLGSWRYLTMSPYSDNFSKSVGLHPRGVQHPKRRLCTGRKETIGLAFNGQLAHIAEPRFAQ